MHSKLSIVGKIAHFLTAQGMGSLKYFCLLIFLPWKKCSIQHNRSVKPQIKYLVQIYPTSFRDITWGVKGFYSWLFQSTEVLIAPRRQLYFH